MKQEAKIVQRNWGFQIQIKKHKTRLNGFHNSETENPFQHLSPKKLKHRLVDKYQIADCSMIDDVRVFVNVEV